MAASNAFRILDLPTELQLIIVELSPLSTVINLRLANKHFNTLIPPLTHVQLLEVETSDLCIRKKLYACSECLRLRPRRKFADDMVGLRRDGAGKDPEERLCIDCGLNAPLGRPYYEDGDRVTINGQTYYCCGDRARFSRKGRRYNQRPPRRWQR